MTDRIRLPGLCASLLARALFAAVLLLSVDARAQNIVFIIADDVGVDGIAAYGEQPAVGPTPNIDALAAQGVLFRNAWTNPICSPSRASMLTGLTPAQHGVGWYTDPNVQEFATGVDPNLPTIPKQLNLVGYRTAAFGKWHMAGSSQSWHHPILAGFDYYAGYLWGGVDHFNWPKTRNGTGPTGTIYTGATSYTTTYASTDTTNDAIAELGGSTPFFLWVAYLNAHTPLHAPPADLHTYDLDGVPISGNEPLYHKAMVQAMDSEIGRLMAGINLSNTTVIFMGDNGTPDAEVEPPFVPGHAKFSVYEGGVNVPLIVAGQAVAPAARGQESAALVQSTDLFETILEIAGASGQTQASVSFLPYLSDPAMPSIRTSTYAEVFKPNGGPPDPNRRAQAARETRYKLQRINTTTDRFYDLQADPWEASPLNLANLTPEQQDAYNRLDQVIDTVPEPVFSLQMLAGTAMLFGIAEFRRARGMRRQRSWMDRTR